MVTSSVTRNRSLPWRHSSTPCDPLPRRIFPGLFPDTTSCHTAVLLAALDSASCVLWCMLLSSLPLGPAVVVYSESCYTEHLGPFRSKRLSALSSLCVLVFTITAWCERDWEREREREKKRWFYFVLLEERRCSFCLVFFCFFSPVTHFNWYIRAPSLSHIHHLNS